MARLLVKAFESTCPQVTGGPADCVGPAQPHKNTPACSAAAPAVHRPPPRGTPPTAPPAMPGQVGLCAARAPAAEAQANLSDGRSPCYLNKPGRRESRGERVHRAGARLRQAALQHLQVQAHHLNRPGRRESRGERGHRAGARLRQAALQHLQVQAHGGAAHGGAAAGGARARDALQHHLGRVLARVAPHGVHVRRRQLARRLQPLPQRLRARRPGPTGDTQILLAVSGAPQRVAVKRSTRSLASARAPWIWSCAAGRKAACLPKSARAAAPVHPDLLGHLLGQPACRQAGVGRHYTATRVEPLLRARGRGRAPAGARAARPPRATRASAAPPG